MKYIPAVQTHGNGMELYGMQYHLRKLELTVLLVRREPLEPLEPLEQLEQQVLLDQQEQMVVEQQTHL
jgi:hypothetical protein